MNSTPSNRALTGSFFALAAFFLWGILPLFWKAFGAIPALEILVHRTAWSFLFVIGLIALRRNWTPVWELLKTPKSIFILFITASLLGGNWLTYIWAVNAGNITETSLGYFINPIVNVCLGMIFLKERLNRWQLASVILVSIGVLNFVFSLDSFPFVALMLAFSFGFYGLLRKTTPVESLVGLSVETAIYLPICLGYIVYLQMQGLGSFGVDWATDVLFISVGMATAVPLLCFAAAAKRLRLSTVGFFQYLGPSIQLFLAVVVYKEPFTQDHLVTFGCIWIALGLYSWPSIQKQFFQK